MNPIRWAGVLLLACCFALAGVRLLAEDTRTSDPSSTEKKKADEAKAGKPASQPAPAPKALPSEPGHVFTNEDLDRLGPAPSQKPPAAPAKEAAPKAGEKPGVAPPDPLKQLQDERSKAAAAATQLADAEKKVAEAEQKVRDLERRKLEVVNPFLAPPQVPPEQAEQWKKMNGPERLKATEDEIAKARKDLDDAKAALQQLQTSGGAH